MKKRIAFIGGGPGALLLLQRALDKLQPCSLTIFEADSGLGCGMPYSSKGTNKEHLTNVSSDEIPKLPSSLVSWLRGLSDTKLSEFDLPRETIDEKIVVSRLLFGEYLQDQFASLIELARARKFDLTLRTKTRVNSLAVRASEVLLGADGGTFVFDTVVICTGHLWLRTVENEVAGYFDSPYPPSKLQHTYDHPVCLRGSSLTAIDAIATISRANGKFERIEGRLHYTVKSDASNFRIDMYSREGLLPAVRVHMDDPYPGSDALIDGEIIQKEIEKNSGFLPLDFMFEEAFLKPLKEDDPIFYESIKNLSIEEFVERMMIERKSVEPFKLLRDEYEQSLQSIRDREAVPWKELLAGLSVAMNYPAKHFSAEDSIRLRKVLMPLIGTIISFAPQQSVEELLALHEAGVLHMNVVGDKSTVVAAGDNDIVYKLDDEDERHYRVFVDCIGQQNLNASELPLNSLVEQGLGRQALVKFKDAEKGARELASHPEKSRKENSDYYMLVPGLDITDHFQLVDKEGHASDLLYMMAVPFIAGLNPDYSGLDFCDNASRLVIDHIHHGHLSKAEQVSNRDAK